jgi:periplasmic protein TonB
MDRRSRWLKHAPAAGAVVLVAVLVIGLVWVIRGFMATKEQKPERRVQNITVIRPPPPPPQETPPPPPPEKVEQPIPQNEPEPAPDNAPTPSQQLGLDAEGNAGDDAFGLAARKGGGDLVGTGGAAFAWYTGKLKDEVADRLSADPQLRAKKYSVGVRVWIESDGRIKDVRLTGSTGSRDIDGAIAAALTSLGRMSQGPPLEMPQPITLQIVSRS